MEPIFGVLVLATFVFAVVLCGVCIALPIMAYKRLKSTEKINTIARAAGQFRCECGQFWREDRIGHKFTCDVCGRQITVISAEFRNAT